MKNMIRYLKCFKTLKTKENINALYIRSNVRNIYDVFFG